MGEKEYPRNSKVEYSAFNRGVQVRFLTGVQKKKRVRSSIGRMSVSKTEDEGSSPYVRANGRLVYLVKHLSCKHE